MELTGNFLATILFMLYELHWLSSWLLQHWCPVISGGFKAAEPDPASVIAGARCNWD